ncbi:MAG: hypothetical protein ACRC2T_08310 [Thermoguttaceae bacterium]
MDNKIPLGGLPGSFSVVSNEKSSSRRWHPSRESDELIFAVCDRFFSQLGVSFQPSLGDPEFLEGDKRGAATAVANWLKDEWGRPDLTREKIYPLFWEASRRGFLLLQPPFEQQLSDRLRKFYDIPDKHGEIIVVNVSSSSTAEHVTSRAADLIVSLIDKVYAEKLANTPKGAPLPSVHLGMGAGYAAMLVAKRMAHRVNSGGECPPLVLHAISAGGFLVDEPHKAPTTYFTYFDSSLTSVKYVALFSETVVSNEDYEKLKMNPGIRVPYEQRDDIDIIVTSLADANHEHGLLVRYLTYLVNQGLLDKGLLNKMFQAGWIGDVQFRPYSVDGPLKDVCPVRAVTLFELDELVELTKKKGKHVVLVAGPCGECGASKKDALRPLLANEKLRLWTHLVTDAKTSRELLEGP